MEGRPGRSGRHCLFVGNYLRDFGALDSFVHGLEQGTTVSIISSCEEAARLRQRLEFNPVKARVLFYSGISDNDFIKLLRNADVFLLALKDGTANTALLEALAAGLAVISFGSYHPFEYLPSKSRLLDRDGEQAASEVEDLFVDPHELEELRASARSKAQSLDWSNIVPKLVALYDYVSGAM